MKILFVVDDVTLFTNLGGCSQRLQFHCLLQCLKPSFLLSDLRSFKAGSLARIKYKSSYGFQSFQIVKKQSSEGADIQSGSVLNHIKCMTEFHHAFFGLQNFEEKYAYCWILRCFVILSHRKHLQMVTDMDMVLWTREIFVLISAIMLSVKFYIWLLQIIIVIHIFPFLTNFIFSFGIYMLWIFFSHAVKFMFKVFNLLN